VNGLRLFIRLADALTAMLRAEGSTQKLLDLSLKPCNDLTMSRNLSEIIAH
jgi:hypothetical protein